MALNQEIADANWRTGSVVHPDSLPDLASAIRAAGRSELAELCMAAGAATIIVSQWCDLVCGSIDEEPFVELLVATPYDLAQDGGEQPYLRSFRRLDIVVGSVTMRLLAKNRVNLPRDLLPKLRRDALRELKLDDAMKVQKWLGMRYSRFPLPGELEARLDLRRDPAKKILDQLTKYTSEIRVKVTPEDQELKATDAYTVAMYVIAKVPLNNLQLTQAYDKLRKWALSLAPRVVVQMHLTDADQFKISQAYETRHLTAEMFTFGKAGAKGPHPTDFGDGA